MKTNGNSPSPKIGDGGILNHSYHVWRQLQHGQEQIIRFGGYHNRFPGKLREQNGHEHRCSVGFLFTYYLIRIRSFVKLDELLLTRCIDLHDVPEGITGLDKPAPLKEDSDDLQEYLVFEKLFKPLGQTVWQELQRCFLLQFALTNPPCFPEDARRSMTTLRRMHLNEALFFQGIQTLDYLYYAYECFVERRNSVLLKEVTTHQFLKIDEIAKKLPGFGKVVWTKPVRDFFSEFNRQGLLDLEKK